MKKFLGLFVKRKEKEGNMYNIYDVPLPDNINNQNRQKNVYKSYDFDCLYTVGCSASLDPKTDEGNTSGYSSQIFSSGEPDIEENRVRCVKDFEPLISDLSSSTSSLSETSTTANQEPKKQNLKGGQKPKKNVFVITINNSKYFHIGSQKTVNISEKVLPAVPKAQRFVENLSLKPEDNLSRLLDCEDKLTEEHISLISQHANKWKEVLRNLGLEETLIEILERRNDNNGSLSLYDGLQEYILLYPNTSLGFVINVLNNTQQPLLVDMLAQEMKIYGTERNQNHIT